MPSYKRVQLDDGEWYVREKDVNAQMKIILDKIDKIMELIK